MNPNQPQAHSPQVNAAKPQEQQSGDPQQAPPKVNPAAHDGFQGSQELSEGGKGDHDLSTMIAAFSPGQAPPKEELQEAQQRGKTGGDLVKERQKDQEILDHGDGAKKAGEADVLKSLQERDDEVRQHENQHVAEAGEFATSGAVLETETASNGRAYATSGKVSVNMAEIDGDPQKTIEKMTKIEKSALKPENPSDQDLRVATEAIGKRDKAERELAVKKEKAREDKQYGIARAPGTEPKPSELAGDPAGA